MKLPQQTTVPSSRVLFTATLAAVAITQVFVGCNSAKPSPPANTGGNPTISGPIAKETQERRQAAGNRVGSDGDSSSVNRQVNRLEIDAGSVAWGDAKKVGARTHILIYAATEAATDKLGLKAAGPSADRLRESWERWGVGANNITIRSGAQVAAAAAEGGMSKVQRDIREIATELKGQNDNLILMWIGHGVHQEGDLQLMTSDTESVNGTPQSTLASRDLANWLGQAKDWGSEELGTALIIDVCQTLSQGLPGVEEDWQKVFDDAKVLADVEAYSAEHGKEAWTDPATNRTLYTNAFCSALDRAHANRGADNVSLTELLDRVRQAPELRDQAPPSPRGKGGVVLFDPNNLSLEVKVVDKVTGNAIPGATVKFQDAQQPAPALFEGLGASREGYSMQVSAPGYFTRGEEVRLERAQSGRTLVVPLAREYVVLQGHIRLPEERGAVRVAVNGSYDGLIDGYHATSDDLSGTGFFNILVPKFTGERKLSVKVAGETRFEETFDLATQTNHNQKVPGGIIQVFDFGDTTLPPKGYPGSQLTGPGQVAVDIGGVKFNFDFDRLTEADFSDSVGWTLYQNVNNYVSTSNKNWYRAERSLEDLRKKKYIRSEKSHVLEELEEELGVAAAIHIAKESYDKGSLDQAIASLRKSNQRDNDKVRVLLYSMLMQGAGKHFQEKDFAQALALYEEAAETQGEEESDATLYAEQARLAWMEDSVKQAYKTGDWETPRKVLTMLTENGSEEAVLKYASEIEQQSISRTCRLRFNSAQAAYSSGDFEEAVEYYRQALTANPNAHYLGLIRGSLEDVSGQLFKKYLTIGSELESKADYLGALDAYLACCKYHPGAGELNLRFIVEEHVELFRKEASDELKQAQAFLKSREIVADYDRSLASGDFVKAKSTLQVIEKGNVDRLELERLLRRMAKAQEDYSMLVFSDYERYKRLSKDAVMENLEFFEAAHPRLRAGLRLARVERFDSSQDAPWIAVYAHEATGLEFSLIPGGVLSMGDIRGHSDQEPVRSVPLYPFLMARTEVSSGVWNKHLKQNRRDNVPFPNRPVPAVHGLAVSWSANLGMALPTEAQWEWAALGAKSNDRVKCEAPSTEDVGYGPANGFGLLNAFDNIAEWCLDTYQEYDVEPAPITGLRRGEAGDRGHVLRGGSFDSELNTGAKRRRYSKVVKAFTGFRPAINVVANPNN